MTVEHPKCIEHLMNARGNSQRGCGQCDCQATGRASTDFGSGFCGYNKGGQRYYVQSAYQMLSDEKIIQEKRSLLHINDSFKKISIKWTLTAENSRRLLTRQHDAGLEVETIKHCGGGQ